MSRDNETGSWGKKLETSVLWWLAGTGTLLAIIAAFLIGLALDSPSAQAQEAGGVYAADIAVVSATCGGGTISITVGPDGNDIRRVEVTGLMYILPQPIGLVVEVPAGDVPIVDGSFVAEQTLDSPVGPVTAFIEGTFSGDSVSGILGVRQFQSICAPSYTATLQAPGATPTPTACPAGEVPVDGGCATATLPPALTPTITPPITSTSMPGTVAEPTATPTALAGAVAALPSVGSGAGGGLATPWVALATVGLALALAAGAVAYRLRAREAD